MESASAFLLLLRDAAGDPHSSNLSESDLVNRLEVVRKQLQHAKASEIPPVSSALVVCHVTSQVLAFVVQYRPLPAQTASSKWHKRVLLLETAVASAFSIIDAELELRSDTRDLCTLYKLLLQRLWETSQPPQQALNGVKVLTKLCVLLAICWLSYDKVGKMRKVESLLNFCSNFCLKLDATKDLVQWPLFLLGMVKMVEKQDLDGALDCFRIAEECGLEESGVFFYWHAVALICSGRPGDAVTTLDKCIRANYDPIACLSLQALVNVQAQDFHTAVEKLQRAMEIDFAQSKSLFNYALLMERMGDFEAQQLLLECIFESRGYESCRTTGKEQNPNDAIKLSASAKTSDALFDEASLESFFPSRLTCVNASMVHFHLAVAAMENGCWMESKKHFEEFQSVGGLHKSPAIVVEAARDYVFVLLQCQLPSLALNKCEEYLLEDGPNTANEDNIVVAKLLLHLYKADALMCLERVDECYEYLKQTVQPMIQDVMRQSYDAQKTRAVCEEIRSCHTQLLNNLAIVMACCSGVGTAVSLLREGLQQYPDCLAIMFNLVLLLWRSGEEAAACSVWFRARGWDLQSKTNESKSTPGGNSLDIATTYQNAATSASTSHTSPISEHVQCTFDGEGGVSAQQLAYLDALILNYYRKTRNAQLVDKSLQYVEYLESLGTTHIAWHN